MPNQRAAHIQQVTLAIDKAIVRQVEHLAEETGVSRNQMFARLTTAALKTHEWRANMDNLTATKK